MKKRKEGILYKILWEIYDPEASALENIILIPLRLLGVFTICYLTNPIMKTYCKYLLISISFALFLYLLEVISLGILYLAIIGLAVGCCCLALELFSFPKFYLECFYEIISVLTAISYISILVSIILDFITFLAFYFNIDEVILNSLLLSSGNTIGDFFSNAALAR